MAQWALSHFSRSSVPCVAWHLASHSLQPLLDFQPPASQATASPSLPIFILQPLSTSPTLQHLPASWFPSSRLSQPPVSPSKLCPQGCGVSGSHSGTPEGLLISISDRSPQSLIIYSCPPVNNKTKKNDRRG